ncbi:MAG: UDP-N-acetylglucosamine 2-epimerase, partial [Cyclobacteriaceae bacterium]
KKKIVKDSLDNISNIELLAPLPYDELIYIMNTSHIILTDSGGIQEEAPTLNVPVIVMREKTERMEGIERGCAILAGTQTKSISSKFSKIMDNESLYNKMASTKNPYGEGNSSEKIISILEDQLPNM